MRTLTSLNLKKEETKVATSLQGHFKEIIGGSIIIINFRFYKRIPPKK